MSEQATTQPGWRAGSPRTGRSRRAFGALPVALLFALTAAGCAAGNIDNTPAPVVLVVGDLTPTSDPFGDVLTSGGTVPEDAIDVDFTARLKNPSDPTQPAVQDIVLERYEVTFARTDGGSAVPAGFQRAMNVRVRVTPHGQQNEFLTTASIVLVPSTIKSQPPLSHLISPGVEPGTGFINIQVTATIRFFGHTVAGEAVAGQASVGINFANFADNN